MINRRTFLGSAIAAAAAVPGIAQQSPWGSPVLDIHVHFRQGPVTNFDHIEGSGVTKAVLLTPVSSEEQAKAAVEQHPNRFVRFAQMDVRKPDAADVIKKSVKDGAIGIGEIKFHLPLDGPEMRRLYAVAGEMNVPVLVHFQEVDHFNGEGVFSSGFSRLPAILKEYPNTTFIGHADAFWANISADVPQNIAYPTGKVKPGGLTDRMLADYPNLYGDLSANSGRNGLGRDPDFTAGFVARHRNKLLFGSDCSCRDGHGAGQVSQEPLIKGKCVARETLTTLKQSASPEVFRKITWENGIKLLKISV